MLKHCEFKDALVRGDQKAMEALQHRQENKRRRQQRLRERQILDRLNRVEATILEKVRA